MTLAQLFPVIVATHVALAVSLLLPSILLPFGLQLSNDRPQDGPGRVSRLLFWLQRNGTLAIGLGLTLTGALLLLTLGTQLISRPWLLLALGLYATNLVVAFFIQRPGLARLLRLRPGDSDAARQRWQGWARRQRYFSYVMAGLIGVIGYLMSTKPDL